MDNNDLLKKSQEVAQDVLNKGKDVLKDALNKAEDMGINEKAKEATEGLSEKAKEASDMIKEKAKEFDLEDAKNSIKGIFDKVSETIKDAKKNSNSIYQEKREDLEENIEEVKTMTENNIKAEIKPGNSNIGKKAASIAVASAAAAGAYTVYKKKKNESDNSRSYFSEKMKGWSQLSKEEILAKKDEVKHYFNVKSNEVYKKGQNAKLGDMVINVSEVGEDLSFNPELVNEPIHKVIDVKEKASEIANTLSNKLKNFTNSFSEIAQNSKMRADELLKEAKERGSEVLENINDKKEEKMDKASELKEDIEDKMDLMADKIEAKTEFTKENFEDAKDEAIDKFDDFKEEAKDKINEVKENAEEIIEENKMESDNLEEKVDNIIEKTEDEIKKVYNPAGRNEKLENAYSDNNGIRWEEESKFINEKTEELKKAASNGFSSLKDTFNQIKKSVLNNISVTKENISDELNEDPEVTQVNEVVEVFEQDAVNNIESILKVAENEEMMIQEFNVVMHNKGEMDFYFNPSLIQRYNTSTRRTVITPIHEEGTTLEARVIKPGETYQGKLAVNLGVNDDALIIFLNSNMDESITILLKDEIDKDFEEKEKEDIIDQLLFEDSEKEI